MEQQNNKYYTPDIKEFRVGFEYEYRDPYYEGREQFRSVRIKTSSIIEFLDDPNEVEDSPHLLQNIEWYLSPTGLKKMILKDYDNTPWIRVKYLDRQDIEELGFKYNKTQPGLNEDYFELILDNEWLYGSSNYYLDYDYDSHYLRIAWFGEGDVTRFSGIIKNKSELRVLLSQIGITTL